MKENLEKSLKRYLKRKVKITLGFITAFAIMGNVGLAVEISGDEELYNKLIKEKQNNIKIRDENIKGLGSNFETTTKYDGNMVINNENGKNKISLKNISGQFVNMEIENKFISSSIKNKIDSLSGEYIKVNNNEIKVLSENNGIIIGQASNAVQATGSEVNKIINNGILYGGQSLELGNDKAINNGIIYFSRADRAAQYTTKENAEIINNGYLRANQKSSGQYSSGINSKLYNYGVIEGYNGQQITKSDSILYNYGIIESLNCGQLNNGGISYNYGKIYAKNNDGINVSEGKTYNFGLIEVNNGYAMNGAGEKYNYGVIKSSNENIFYEANPSNPKQNILNKGIIISENAENLKDKIWVTNSALFDNDYNLLTLNAISIENEKLNSDDFKSSNEEEKDKQVAAIVNGSAELSGIFDGKTIASVVHGNKENTTVFTLGDGETVLKDTSLVGYFENEGGGTLLKVEADKTLTLDGETKITAVKDLQNGDIGEVIALELEKDSTLNIMSDDVEINGIIKGLGENARINAYSLKSEISSEDTSVFLSNIKDENLTDYVAENNFTEATISGNKLDNLTFDFSNTAKDKKNTVIIKDGVSINTG